MDYQKIKKILIWIPVLGTFIVFLEPKKLFSASMHEEFFNYGSVWLVPLSLLWHSGIGIMLLIIFY